MSQTIILDAGPCLSFCAAAQQRIAYDTLSTIGELCAPTRVHREILHKSEADPRFRAAARNWNTLVAASRIRILPDTPTPELNRIMMALQGVDVVERLRHGKDSGETMVIAHALALREAGTEVIVLIDDGAGARTANRFGLRLINTPMVLRLAARRGIIKDRAHMRKIYSLLRPLDDGLVDIHQTEPNLLDPNLFIAS
ncbi:MAG: hypothetical protein LBM66_00340 [Bifidobacteriaceae bacterium]|jgi:predicted nucleic acid-binding protein|nr:hypothetical protein [Bifidobacteriaceae bacterium]